MQGRVLRQSENLKQFVSGSFFLYRKLRSYREKNFDSIVMKILS